MTRLLLLLPVLFITLAGPVYSAEERPNILWLTAEDIGPHLGCYGDSYATTPNLDRFAARSILYTNAWSNAPVCAPARTTIISGMYPTSTGSEHMRSLTRLPEPFQMYPVELRRAGYFCINHVKEDYNLAKPEGLWDQAPRKNPWPKLKNHQPFMAVFNYTGTHESQIRKRPHVWKHDPAKAPVPSYHPDTLEVRQDWAQYYDNITEMDQWFGEQLKQLEAQGLSDNTIVFFFGDHGSGMPRHKRWLYNTGLRVPLLIHVPERFRHLVPEGVSPTGPCDRLVSFVDLAPTLNRLAGQKPPEYLQGSAFLGKNTAPPRRYLYGFRGRMDERIDLSRTVRNERFHYIRNYFPHLAQGEYLAYMFQTPTTRKWNELFLAGQLNEAQRGFWEPKPPEELYDLEADPEEIHNLVNSPEHAEILEELRRANTEHLLRIRDVGFLPEAEFHRGKDLTPYEIGHDQDRYPLEEILRMADAASGLLQESPAILAQGLKHSNDAVRFWAATGLLVHGQQTVETHRDVLRTMIQKDPSPSVRVAAAESLGQSGHSDDLLAAVDVLLDLANPQREGPYVSLAALNALDHLKERSPSIREGVQHLDLPEKIDAMRGGAYHTRMKEAILRESRH